MIRYRIEWEERENNTWMTLTPFGNYFIFKDKDKAWGAYATKINKAHGKTETTLLSPELKKTRRQIEKLVEADILLNLDLIASYARGIGVITP